jgi:protein-S-isoprenylcysteine O-methyltransferase Ste14
MPVSVVGMAFVFNSVNAGLNAWWLFDLSGGYPATWLLDPRFVAGAALFLAGMAVNRGADATLRHLHDEVPSPYGADTSSCTAAPETYRIPHGGLYRRISCPNYLGEIVQWCGWALATWSLPGLAFAAWTAANLVPRAGANHAWYRERFPNYPPERRALLPGLW